MTTWGWNRNPLGGTRIPTGNGGNGNGGQGTRTSARPSGGITPRPSAPNSVRPSITSAPFHLSGLPTLSRVEPPYSGSECSSYLHTTMCNGDGGHQACVTQDLCVPTRPCYYTYSASGTPSCSGEYSICLSTTIFTRCGLVGGIAARADATPAPSPNVIGDATVTAALSVPTSDPSLKLEEDHHLPRHHHPHAYQPAEPASPSHGHDESADNELEVSVPNVPQNQSSAATSELSLISARQNAVGCGGSANGGCDYFRFCASGMCAKTEKVPCLQAHIKAHMGVTSGIDLEATVTEDGVLKCKATRHCPLLWDDDCGGVDTFDCGDGSTMGFKYNYVQYYSKKYDRKYPMYLELSVDAKLVFCIQEVLFRKIPYVCWEDEYEWKDGPCKGLGL
jgi:hypothetical protein